MTGPSSSPLPGDLPDNTSAAGASGSTRVAAPRTSGSANAVGHRSFGAPGSTRATPLPMAPNVRALGRQSPPIRYPLRLPLALFAISLGLIVLHQSRIVELFFPLGAFLVALRFYRSSPAHYLGFVCWLFFLTPEVRRLADYMSGTFSEKSLIMIAPLAAVSLCGFTLLRHANLLGQRRAAPLVMIMLALFYAYIVGMAQVGISAATFTLINWLFPVLVAFQLVATWQDYPIYHRVLLKTFVYGGLAIGLYGVIEFIFVPPWDAFWLQASGMTSEGNAVPFQMRVGSTMNSSGPFAVTIMALILLALAARGKVRMLMLMVAVPALMFTAVRGAWGGLVIGLIYPLAMLDGRERLKLIGGVMVVMMLGAPVLMIDEVAEPVMKRFDTILNISNDTSFQERTDFYKRFLSQALTDVAGQGLGTTGIGTKLADSDGPTSRSVDFDSGLMEVPLVMGWPGTLLYAGGVLLLVWRAFLASRLRSKDRLAICGVGLALAIFAMLIFVNTLIGISGLFFFIGVSMPVIGLRHARAVRASWAYVSQAAQHGPGAPGGTGAGGAGGAGGVKGGGVPDGPGGPAAPAGSARSWGKRGSSAPWPANFNPASPIHPRNREVRP
ncbi:O-antigen ligase family protein [Paraburkholderia sp.]|uniref:O-antigen ligase family protein n=1 Tax=Paraburkholderia sp. TaxID=1926495 RepID=UPI002398A5BA|nr:O-antigen ligase family protein [Paraburkholderia sp.]MDE1184684.1 O-antigen ligase family protein [Paraburkholderia sp.]